MTKNKNNFISIKTEIAADIDAVWEQWTKPEHITNWNFASDEWCCPDATNDLRKGGKFTWRMESKDGETGFDFGGTYEEVVPKERLSYRLIDDRNVTVTFRKKDNVVELEEVFEPEQVNSIDMQREGWQAILSNFKEYVESEK